MVWREGENQPPVEADQGPPPSPLLNGLTWAGDETESEALDAIGEASATSAADRAAREIRILVPIGVTSFRAPKARTTRQRRGRG